MTGLRVVVFHRAVGFVHLSIPDAVAAIERLGDAHGAAVTSTDDPDALVELLSSCDVVVFVHTSGDVLPEPAHREALERFMRRGGGFLGVHAAASMGDVAIEWPWFAELVGATFKGHTLAHVYCDHPLEERPGTSYAGPLASAPVGADRWGTMAVMSCEPATVRVEDPGCGAIGDVVDGDVLVDEWYGFHENPRPHVNVVATVEEATYSPHAGSMGDDHPIVWWREFGGGRSVYNSMGHAAAAWRDERFLSTIVGGIGLAAWQTGPGAR